SALALGATEDLAGHLVGCAVHRTTFRTCEANCVRFALPLGRGCSMFRLRILNERGGSPLQRGIDQLLRNGKVANGTTHRLVFGVCDDGLAAKGAVKPESHRLNSLSVHWLAWQGRYGCSCCRRRSPKKRTRVGGDSAFRLSFFSCCSRLSPEATLSI